ncbi:site-specific integrase [uncultured Pseudoalteromonas sp.]|uniref:tyrosine-type recombinase/integrase n=1 Tax=uncultured Pseudoalteromonas sp. TaxID=114053 RepID=UPI00259A6F45|nr:site-specific integrase [uncultured Pseudoalteromonas sp.]
MDSRFNHLLSKEISQDLPALKENTPLVIRDHECPIFAYINSLPSNASKSTAVRALQSIAQHLGQPSFYHIKWVNVDKNAISSLVGILQEKKLSSDTVGLYLSIIKSVLKEAFLLGQITGLQWERVKSVKRPTAAKRRKHATLNPQEFEGLLALVDEKAGSNVKAIRDKAIFHALIGLGLRRYELVKLQMEDIDFEGESITFYGKGNKERDVFIHSITLHALKEWIKIRGDKPGPIFTKLFRNGILPPQLDIKNNEPVIGLVTESIYLLCRFYGLTAKGIAPHSLRRSYATWLHNNGADIYHIARLLGHASIKTTEIYIKVEDDGVKNTVLSKLF